MRLNQALTKFFNIPSSLDFEKNNPTYEKFVHFTFYCLYSWIWRNWYFEFGGDSMPTSSRVPDIFRGTTLKKINPMFK